jgi:hypothetical protein
MCDGHAGPSDLAIHFKHSHPPSPALIGICEICVICGSTSAPRSLRPSLSCLNHRKPIEHLSPVNLPFKLRQGLRIAAEDCRAMQEVLLDYSCRIFSELDTHLEIFIGD